MKTPARLLGFAGIAVTVALLAPLPPAIGKETAPDRQGSPAGELGQLRAFLGRWSCQGKRLASAQAPEQPFEAVYEFTADLDGSWIATQYEERRTAANPQPLKIKEHWGYDLASRRYVNWWVSNGGSGGAFYSKGWQGKDWIWETREFPLGNSVVPMRATFRLGEGSFVATPTMAGPDGTWMPFAEFTCRR